jgi:hypothetical protein
VAGPGSFIAFPVASVAQETARPERRIRRSVLSLERR